VLASYFFAQDYHLTCPHCGMIVIVPRKSKHGTEITCSFCMRKSRFIHQYNIVGLRKLEQELRVTSEFQTYDEFAYWLKLKFRSTNNREQMKILQRIRLHPNLECDLIGIRKHEKADRYIVVSVEVKIANFDKVLKQALIRSKFSNYTYIGIASFEYFEYNTQNIFRHYEQLTKNGIGVLIYDELRNRVFELIHAYYRKDIEDPKRRSEVISYYKDLRSYLSMKEVSNSV